MSVAKVWMHGRSGASVVLPLAAAALMAWLSVLPVSARFSLASTPALPPSWKVALVYFGYAECSGVCQASLGRLARVMMDLEARGWADQAGVFFVDLDPTAAASAARGFSRVFHPRFLGGTTGDPPLEDLRRELGMPRALGVAGRRPEHEDRVYLLARDKTPGAAAGWSLRVMVPTGGLEIARLVSASEELLREPERR